LYRWNIHIRGYDDGLLGSGQKHSIKIRGGAPFERMLLQVTALTDPNGIWFFNDLQSYLTNVPKKVFRAASPARSPPRNLRQSIVGGYNPGRLALEIEFDSQFSVSATNQCGFLESFIISVLKGLLITVCRRPIGPANTVFLERTMPFFRYSWKRL